MLGVMVAVKFSKATTTFLQTALSNKSDLMFIAGFLLTFVVTMVFIRMLARGFEGILKSANINIINQIMGGTLLAGLMILLYSVFVWFGDSARFIDAQTKKESMTYPYLKEFPGQAQQLTARFKPVFKDFYDQAMNALDNIEDVGIKRSESDPSVYDIPDEDDRTKSKKE